MRRFFRILLTAGRLLLRSTVTLAVVIAVSASLLTAGLMTVSSTLFSAVAAVVEAIHDGATFRNRQVAEIGSRDARIAAQANEIVSLRTELEQHDLEIRRSAIAITELEAERIVTIDGERRLLREVVTETTAEVSSIAARSAARNIASMPGEGLPIAGIAVVVVATGLEVKDACDISTAMYELDIAMNPDHAITDRVEVCGMPVYTAEELWSKIIESPGAIWGEMTELYADLPAMGQMWDWVVSTLKATPGEMWSLLVYIWDTVANIELPDWDWPDWDLNPFND